MPHYLKFSSCPFDRDEASKHLPYDLDRAVYIEVTQHEQPLYTNMWRYLSKKAAEGENGLKSVRADLTPHADDVDDVLAMVKGKGRGQRFLGGVGAEIESLRKRKSEVPMPEALLGLGWHSVDFEVDEKTVPITVVYQRLGDPTGDGAAFFTSIVVFAEGPDKDILLKLCQAATESQTKTKENRVSLWRFDIKFGHWNCFARRLSRSIESVVLDDTVKRPLLDDVEWFVKDETRVFYAKHGIPYHRCYLLHGEPGTGKTSLMYALSGYLERNLCFIQMDKAMTDDTFRNAMSRLPQSPLLVLEDVDALFTHHREAESKHSSLSFSGFLNCLDGIGAPDDVVICMTTNHPERLDPAVMRPGRIDIKVAFKTPSKEAAAKYFLTFYPEAHEAAVVFGKAVGGRIAERKVSMAQLQHFFLASHRMNLNAEKAAEHIREFKFDDLGEKSGWTNSYA
eukprot:TRINITY_DN13158_c0_g2_i3.p1 TRINITY_DN13158_c0_g2~~TRINITY_DN13158_c0_g2_i3.p1  ORF type:complete len:452 (+),score=93.53 TRINITY_DN13158_c0_g2_i3:140-1495(+)